MRLMTAQHSHDSAGFDIPQLDEVAAVTGRQQPAIGAERQAEELSALLLLERAHFTTAVDVPPFHGLVAHRSQATTIGAESDADVYARITGQRVQQAAIGIPDLDGLVPAARGEALAVGARRQA